MTRAALTARGYRPPTLSLAWDLFVLAIATLTGRSARTLLRWLSRPFAVHVEGEQHVPRDGAFVIALNHFSDGASGAIVRAALDAVGDACPSALDRVLMVGGRRGRVPKSRFARWLRALAAPIGRALRWRWSAHLVVIAMSEARPDWGALRQWKRRASERVSVVFPEGIAGVQLGAIRDGAGRWLATIGVPTLPCAAWFDGQQWRVRFGPLVLWAKHTKVHDAQLGLALAELLPPALQGGWAADLERVRRLRAPHAE